MAAPHALAHAPSPVSPSPGPVRGRVLRQFIPVDFRPTQLHDMVLDKATGVWRKVDGLGEETLDVSDVSSRSSDEGPAAASPPRPALPTNPSKSATPKTTTPSTAASASGAGGAKGAGRFDAMFAQELDDSWGADADSETSPGTHEDVRPEEAIDDPMSSPRTSTLVLNENAPPPRSHTRHNRHLMQNRPFIDMLSPNHRRLEELFDHAAAPPSKPRDASPSRPSADAAPSTASPAHAGSRAASRAWGDEGLLGALEMMASLGAQDLSPSGAGSLAGRSPSVHASAAATPATASRVTKADAAISPMSVESTARSAVRRALEEARWLDARTLAAHGEDARVTRLALQRRGIAGVKGLASFSRLSELDLAGNHIADAGRALPDVPPGVSSLCLASTGLATLGMLPSRLAGLRTLDLSGNGLGSLSGIGACEHLVHLNVAANALSSLHEIAGLSRLRTLDVSCNSIASLVDIPPLSRLERLGAQSNAIAGLAGLARFPSLTWLDVSGNLLRGFDTVALDDSSDIGLEGSPPRSEGAPMPPLVTLVAAGNRVACLGGLEWLPALAFLDVSDNALASFDGWNASVPNARVILAPRNAIGDVGLLSLSRLELLDVSHNRVRSLLSLCGCVALRHLDVSDNAVEHDSGALGKTARGGSAGGDVQYFVELRSLDLSGNALVDLGICTDPRFSLRRLQRLEASRNQIASGSRLAEDLRQLPRIECVDVRGNPALHDAYPDYSARDDASSVASGAGITCFREQPVPMARFGDVRTSSLPPDGHAGSILDGAEWADIEVYDARHPVGARSRMRHRARVLGWASDTLDILDGIRVSQAERERAVLRAKRAISASSESLSATQATADVLSRPAPQAGSPSHSPAAQRRAGGTRPLHAPPAVHAESSSHTGQAVRQERSSPPRRPSPRTERRAVSRTVDEFLSDTSADAAAALMRRFQEEHFQMRKKAVAPRPTAWEVSRTDDTHGDVPAEELRVDGRARKLWDRSSHSQSAPASSGAADVPLSFWVPVNPAPPVADPDTESARTDSPVDVSPHAQRGPFGGAAPFAPSTPADRRRLYEERVRELRQHGPRSSGKKRALTETTRARFHEHRQAERLTTGSSHARGHEGLVVWGRPAPRTHINPDYKPAPAPSHAALDGRASVKLAPASVRAVADRPVPSSPAKATVGPWDISTDFGGDADLHTSRTRVPVAQTRQRSARGGDWEALQPY